MRTPPRLPGAVVTALAAVRRRAARAIAAETPADVTVTLIGDDIALTGRALAVRAATDPRLRDFAAIVRAAS